MIRGQRDPRNEGLRLHFIVNQATKIFSAIAASSKPSFKLDAPKRIP
jgi:hypothetical protein